MPVGTSSRFCAKAKRPVTDVNGARSTEALVCNRSLSVVMGTTAVSKGSSTISANRCVLAFEFTYEVPSWMFEGVSLSPEFRIALGKKKNGLNSGIETSATPER